MLYAKEKYFLNLILTHRKKIVNFNYIEINLYH